MVVFKEAALLPALLHPVLSTHSFSFCHQQRLSIWHFNFHKSNQIKVQTQSVMGSWSYFQLFVTLLEYLAFPNLLLFSQVLEYEFKAHHT